MAHSIGRIRIVIMDYDAYVTYILLDAYGLKKIDNGCTNHCFVPSFFHSLFCCMSKARRLYRAQDA